MDRTIHFGDSETDARYRIQDTSSTGGDFILVEDLDGGTVLLEYDYSAGEFVSRGPVNLNGNGITDAGSVSADTLEATGTLTGPAGNTTTDLTTLSGKVYYQTSEPTDTPDPSGGGGAVWYPKDTVRPKEWSYNTGNTISDIAHATNESLVIVSSGSNTVTAVDPVDGSEEWVFTTGGSTGPVAYDPSTSTIVTTSRDDNLYAINATDGTQKWSSSYAFSSTSSEIKIDSVNNNAVFVQDDQAAIGSVSLSDGSEIFRNTLNDFTSAALGVSDTVATVDDDDTIRAYDLTTGSSEWTYSSDVGFRECGGEINTDDDIVYYGASGAFIGLNLADGTEAFDVNVGEFQYTGRPLYVSGDDVVIAVNQDNNIYALDATTGAEQYSIQTTEQSNTKPIYVPSQDIVLTADENNNTYVFDPTDGSLGWDNLDTSWGRNGFYDDNLEKFIAADAFGNSVFAISERDFYETPRVSNGSEWTEAK